MVWRGGLVLFGVIVYTCCDSVLAFAPHSLFASRFAFSRCVSVCQVACWAYVCLPVGPMCISTHVHHYTSTFFNHTYHACTHAHTLARTHTNLHTHICTPQISAWSGWTCADTKLKSICAAHGNRRLSHQSYLFRCHGCVCLYLSMYMYSSRCACRTHTHEHTHNHTTHTLHTHVRTHAAFFLYISPMPSTRLCVCVCVYLCTLLQVLS